MHIRSRTALVAVLPILGFAWACGSSSTNNANGRSTGQGSSSNQTNGGSSGGSNTGGTSGNSSQSNASGGSGSNTGSSGGGSGTSGTSASGSSGSSASASSGSPTVHLDQKDQTIEGFGINDMYQSTALPTSLFDATNGIGLTILRLGMDTAGAGNLQSPTSMATDIATVNGVGGKVIGSVWTPPQNCKTNNDVNNGGQLCSANTLSLPNDSTNACTATAKSNCYMTWAQTITKFATTNKLFAMSLANEPEFASCGTNEPCNGTYPTAVYSANEMVAFTKVAGPMLKNAGVKVIAPETSEWNHLWGNQSACGSVPSGDKSSDPLGCGCFVSNSSTPSATCSAAAAVACSTACTTMGNGYDYGHALHADSAAWGDLDIIGTHEYDDQTAFPWPSDFAKDKEVWVTEMAGVKWWPEQGTGSGASLAGTSDINDGVVVAGWIHSALVTGEASAWLWWWYQPLTGGTNDNEGLLLANGTDTKRHYTLGNYSKFVRPGYVRVDMSGSPPANVLLSAYSGSGNTVVVAINSGTTTASVPISITGGTAPASCTPYLTSSSANLAAQTAVPVSGGSFTASLVGPSVTTFVCK